MRTPRTAAKWIRSATDELAVAHGCYYDAAAGDRPCDFLERFCLQSKGRWRGQALELLDWQRDFIRRLFGWQRANGLRRYRSAYLEVAKKNGKSTILSGIALYLLIADGLRTPTGWQKEGAPEIHLNACDKDQAGIIFEESRRMIGASDYFRARLEVINSKGDKRIIHRAGDGVIVANSALVQNKDGYGPSAVIFDELHRQPDHELWNVFEFAGAGREQPLRLSITTAGEAAEGVWFEQRERSEQINNGTVPDITHLGVVYRAEESDDPDDPATWKKANPSLGVLLKPDDFREDLERAKQTPEAWAYFKRVKLNIITRQESKFVNLTTWDENATPPDIAPGAALWGGLDLANVDDMTAFVAVAEDGRGGLDVMVRFWLPSRRIVQLEHDHRVPYRAWADRGLITLAPGESLDYEFVRRELNTIAAEYTLKKLISDPFNADQLLKALRDSDGLPCVNMRQGFLSLNAPTKELLRLVLARQLNHGGHPILRWMAGNAVAASDAALNIKLEKRRGREKIDGMSALVNAIAGYMDGQAGEQPSPCEDPNYRLLVLR